PATREASLLELRDLADAARGRPGGAPLRLVEVDAAVGNASACLRLLLLPSIFAPEAWAFTFLEGLLAVPHDEYAGKRLVEVGTGSGWIPIALAKFTDLNAIHGVDLNPHAPLVATCNAWLNCSEEELERLSFSQGDLLRSVPEQQWDFVAGCIPQVLREDQPAAPAEDADERALYDLSNYCAIQNVYEDHFGLGLIARLLDESPERLAPGGKLLLNLAGRPGRAIIERMFSRRGFRTEVLVSRRVRQAADTDIGPLVSLERSTGREFEFFLEQHSAEPIRAETALGWLAQGNPIWHEVAVWRAELRHPREILALRGALRKLGSDRLLADLDLGAASQEQLDYVAALAGRLADDPRIPYAHEAGDRRFRSLIARYLERFYELRLDEGEIFVGPERKQTVRSLLLATCDPGDGVLVTRNLLDEYAGALEASGVKATVTNDTLRDVRRLLGAFDVKVVLLAVEPEERTNLSVLRAIVQEAASRGILVVIDESAFFTITSGVAPRTLFEFLAQEPQPDNLVVLYGLVKNAVQPDFELTFLLPVPPALHAELEVAAEVTYSRISTPVQWFYERLFASLLSFRISFTTEAPPRRRMASAPLPRSRRMARVAAHPAFAPKIFREDDPELIRLDYGENELEIPRPLAEGLIAACAAPFEVPKVHGLEEAICAFLAETRGLAFSPADVALAQGVWPLIHDAAAVLRARLGRAPRVFVAAPCYGVLPPTLEAAGCEIVAAPLERLYGPDRESPDAVVISQPSNPEGRYLSRDELRRLAEFAVRHDALVFSDEIFGLVDLARPDAADVLSPASLEGEVPGIQERVLIFGGLSKEFAAGGLRVGWLATRRPGFAAQVGRAGLAGLQLASAR
ncbi:MAG TPA: aminotransferase class I/II-fold pyridoxal phosphate-dependent enzyme, partial [Vulgatibacter sp.]|nr:aminotransferase class I/II-fold pyridoxal phosphate-dependent enzyme [Vulgatibacter sp.]